MDPTPQPEVKKDEKKTNQTRGENRKREPKPRQVQYVVKGEEGETQPEQKEQKKEEHQGGEKQKKARREERERPQFDWDRTKITLESKVPELPPHVPQKPEKEQHYKNLDKIDEEIRKQWDHFNHFVEDVKKQQQQARQGNHDKFQNEVKPLGQVIGEKSKLLNEKREELKRMKGENDALKEQINKLHDQAQEYRQKMKSLDNPDVIIDELARLKESLQQDRLSANEEKRIVSQIAALERSLPFVEPLQKLEKEQKALRTKSQAISKVMQPLYQNIQEMSEELNHYRADYDKLKDSTKEQPVIKQNPLIDEKRKDVEAKVLELKERKEKVRKEYNASWDKYEDYEDLKKYREWFLRQLDWQKRETEKKKKDEERKKREEARAKREADQVAEEKAEADAKAKELENVNPFQYQVELCETLINYCTKLKPTAAQQQAQQQKQVDIEQVLKSDEWKKEKCTVLKKDSGEDDIYNFSSLKALKDKKKKSQPQQQKEVKEEKKSDKPEILQHDLQTLQFFDTIKVATPFYQTELDKVLNSLNERREYYLNKENWGKTEESGAKDTKQAKKQEKAQNQDEFPALQ